MKAETSFKDIYADKHDGVCYGDRRVMQVYPWAKVMLRRFEIDAVLVADMSAIPFLSPILVW